MALWSSDAGHHWRILPGTHGPRGVAATESTVWIAGDGFLAAAHGSHAPSRADTARHAS